MTADEFETYVEESVAFTSERDDLIATLRGIAATLRQIEATA